jgi:AcrR family transcriptional regulator
MDFKEMVLVKAKEVFVRYGYSKSTMNDIARACHKSKGLIYHHFKSKEEILQIIADREISDIMLTVTQALQNAADPVSRIKSIVINLTRMISDKNGIYNRVLMDLDEYMVHLEDTVRSLLEQLTKVVDTIISDGVDEGVFDVPSPAIAATSIVSLMFNTALQPIVALERFFKPDIKVTADIIARGLLKRG